MSYLYEGKLTLHFRARGLDEAHPLWRKAVEAAEDVLALYEPVVKDSACWAHESNSKAKS